MYKKYKDIESNTVAEFAIIRIKDNACIPFVEDNTDYQTYLKWLAEGNIPEEAE